MKQCNECKEGKSLDEFNNDKRNKTNGKCGRCRDCQKAYYERNKEGKKQQVNEYYQNNKEKCRQRQDSYDERNKEYLRQRQKENYQNKKEHHRQLNRQRMGSPLGYNRTIKLRQEIELYEEIRESKNGNVECKCTYCGEGFEPTKRQISRRLEAINGKLEGESRLYCSDKCRDNCPIYKQHGYERGYKPETSREVQPQLRQLVFERDNYTCQKCGNHRDELETGLHCHHIEPLTENPVESADIDNSITLCEDCHKEAHQIPGCTSSELRCAS